MPDDGGERLLSKGEVIARVNLSFPTLWLKMRRGKFPLARAVDGRTFWLQSEIDAWLRDLPIKKYKAAPR
jgi:predicted DNA-binding transcriptional regulator AlpA